MTGDLSVSAGMAVSAHPAPARNWLLGSFLGHELHLFLLWAFSVGMRLAISGCGTFRLVMVPTCHAEGFVAVVNSWRW